MTAAPVASVVIPCLDAESTLAGQLEALRNQVGAPPFEVIVADNGSTDASRRIARSFADGGLMLRTLDASDRRGAAHARNRGAGEASADRILFCDADDEVHATWVAAMSSALDHHDLVASRFETERLNPPDIRRVHGVHPQSLGLNPYTYPPFLPHAGAGGLGVRREVHERLGGFDESLPALEDTDYCWRAQLDGFDLGWEERAVVSIRYPQGSHAAFRQGRSYGEHNVALYARYRDRGMPHLGPFPGLLKAAALLARSPALLLPGRRTAWFWQAGWRWGRVLGCVRHRVSAL